MVLSETEISKMMTGQNEWLVFLKDDSGWRHFGDRALPNEAGPE